VKAQLKITPRRFEVQAEINRMAGSVVNKDTKIIDLVALITN